MKKMTKYSSSYWMLVGPAALFLSFLLLFFRSYAFLTKPFWFIGLLLAASIACLLTYLSFREGLVLFEEVSHEKKEGQKSLQYAFETLKESDRIYREKIDKLEEVISLLEEEKDQVQKELQSREYLAKTHKGQSSAFRLSLEEALTEMRSLREEAYIHHEMGRIYPKDLPNQHKQLRGQFEEKALMLEQTRRRLFSIEGQLHAVKKEIQLEQLEVDPLENAYLQMMDELTVENKRLQEEIFLLETLVTPIEKSPKEKKSKKRPEEVLELQF